MSDFVLGFGGEEAGGGSSSAFSPGINEDVSLTTFQYVKENDYEYVQLVFTKEGSEIRDRVYAPKNFPPRMKKDKTMETELEARGRIWGDVNAKIRHIITNFVTAEAFDNRIKEARVQNYQQFCLAAASLLPPDHAARKGQLVVGYNQKGFLSTPYAMWVNGPFFSVNGAKGPLTVSKNLKLTRPESASEAEVVEEAVPVSWMTSSNDESEINLL
jgi:hypothetical protein